MNICGDKKQADIDHSQKKLVLFPATLLLARPWKLVGVQKKEGVQSQHHDFLPLPSIDLILYWLGTLRSLPRPPNCPVIYQNYLLLRTRRASFKGNSGGPCKP